MLEGLIKLLAFQVAGEAVVFLLSIPVPGPVVGMALLFIWLAVRGKPDLELEAFSSGLLRHLSLLFIPAAVGIMAHLARIATEWLALTIALCVSTVAAVVVTAMVARVLKR